MPIHPPPSGLRSQAAFKIVTHVKWTSEKFRRDVIPLHEKIAALFSFGDEGNGIGFDFHLQPGLICDVAQCFPERNLIQLNRYVPASPAEVQRVDYLPG